MRRPAIRQRQAPGEVPAHVLRRWIVAIYERPWTWCATLPFPTPVAPQEATDLFQAWLRRLEQQTKAPVRAVSVLESNGTGVVRIHALIADVQSLRSTTGAKAWQDLTGVIAGIFPFDPERARQCTLDIAASNSVAFGESWVPRGRPGGPLSRQRPPDTPRRPPVEQS